MAEQNVHNEAEKGHKRRRSTTEGRLLQAGLEVFSELGYDAATTRLIAQRAETNEALIHRYFGSKKGLLDAVIIKFIEEQTGVHDYAAGATIEEELTNYIQFKVPIYLRSKDLIRIMMSRISLDAELNEKTRQTAPLEGDPFLAERLRMLQEKGLVRPDIDVKETAFNIGFYVFAAIYLGHINMGKDVTLALQEFIKITSRGMLPQS